MSPWGRGERRKRKKKEKKRERERGRERERERGRVERTDKTEIRAEEQGEGTESCRENLWSERVIKTETDTRTE